MIRFKTYYATWKLLAINSLQEAFVNRGSNLIFILGKLIRLAMSVIFLSLLRQNIADFAHYTPDQVMIFFLTYHFIDLFSQTIFRGVYNFGYKIRSGEFDFYLAKPLNPLFQALVGRPDIDDAIFIFPSIAVAIWLISTLKIALTSSSIVWFGLLFINSMLISTGLHILVLSVGVLTTEVEGVIWVFRDLSKLGQFPVSIYLEPLRFALFFLIPIGTMITIPAEVLLNLNPTYSIFTSIIVGLGFFVTSLILWNWSLKKYSSASS